MKGLRIRRPLRLVGEWLARYRGPEPEPLGILFGIRAVARFMGVSKNQARSLARRGAIPTFDLDGVTCARRSVLRQHVETLERAGPTAPAGDNSENHTKLCDKPLHPYKFVRGSLHRNEDGR